MFYLFSAAAYMLLLSVVEKLHSRCCWTVINY